MNLKRMTAPLALLVTAVVILSASASPQFYNFPQLQNSAEEMDFHAPAQYKFDYAVHDADSGDVKSQWEHRDGDDVKGSYTVHDPDGTVRTVEYTADKVNGFNAVVKKQGNSYHPPVYGSSKDELF